MREAPRRDDRGENVGAKEGEWWRLHKKTTTAVWLVAKNRIEQQRHLLRK